MADVAGPLTRLLEKLAKTVGPKTAEFATKTYGGAPLTRAFAPDELEAIREAKVLLRRRTLNDIFGPEQRMLNVHESNKTAAAAGAKLSREIRGEWEPAFFGGTDVNYGYLTSDPHSFARGELETFYPKENRKPQFLRPATVLPQYGAYGLEIKPEVRGRTTFTLGDSLDEARGPYTTSEMIVKPFGPHHDIAHKDSQLMGSAQEYYDAMESLSKARKDKWFPQEEIASEMEKLGFGRTFRDYLRKKGLDLPDGVAGGQFPRLLARPLEAPDAYPLMPTETWMLNDAERGNGDRLGRTLRKPGGFMDGYVEAQVHGGLRPDDIARLWDFSYEPSSALEKRMKKFGIEYVPMPSDNIFNSVRDRGIATYGDLIDAFGHEVYQGGRRHSLEFGPIRGYDLDLRKKPLPGFGQSFRRGGRVGALSCL